MMLNKSDFDIETIYCFQSKKISWLSKQSLPVLF